MQWRLDQCWLNAGALPLLILVLPLAMLQLPRIRRSPCLTNMPVALISLYLLCLAWLCCNSGHRGRNNSIGTIIPEEVARRVIHRCASEA